VRGYSFFGDSYVYIIFDDKTDLYWARSRVLEYLNQVTGRLPPSAKAVVGAGWHRRRAGFTNTRSSTTAGNTTPRNWRASAGLVSEI